TPNEISCTEYDTRGVCSASGLTLIPNSCAPGRCIDGACTTGKDTGESCTTAAECAGKSCQCANGMCAGTPLEGGYCTTSGCETYGCALDEVGVNLALGTRTLPNDCIVDCTDCTRAGFACREFPQ